MQLYFAIKTMVSNRIKKLAPFLIAVLSDIPTLLLKYMHMFFVSSKVGGNGTST
jgi:hypothetical protein